MERYACDNEKAVLEVVEKRRRKDKLVSTVLADAEMQEVIVRKTRELDFAGA